MTVPTYTGYDNDTNIYQIWQRTQSRQKMTTEATYTIYEDRTKLDRIW
jgi:hypothetical protein